MRCSACGAPVVEDRFREWAARWRCLKCGGIHDSKSAQTDLVKDDGLILETTEPDYCDEEVHLGLESFVVAGLSCLGKLQAL
jgi:hypothetical protein